LKIRKEIARLIKLKKIKAVLLDLEGNLVDVEKAHHLSHLAVLRDWGVILSFDEALKMIPAFIGGPDERVAEAAVKLSKERTGEEHTIAEYLNAKGTYYKKFLREISIALRLGVPETIEWFKKIGLKIVVGSVTNTDQAKFLIEKSGLGKLIGEENFIFREDVTHPKPDPEVVTKGASKLGVKPEEIVYFGDSPGDMRTARNAHCPFVIAMPVFDKPELMKRLIDEGASRIFMGWTEVDFPSLFENLDQELIDKNHQSA